MKTERLVIGLEQRGRKCISSSQGARAKTTEKAAKDIVRKEAHMAHTAREPQLSIRRKIGPERPGSASPCWASAYDKSLGFSRNCKGAFEGLMNTAV